MVILLMTLMVLGITLIPWAIGKTIIRHWPDSGFPGVYEEMPWAVGMLVLLLITLAILLLSFFYFLATDITNSMN